MAGVVSSLWLVACVEDGTSLRIECPTHPIEEDGVCVVGDLDACLAQGAMNVTEARSYGMSLYLTSGLVPRESNIPVMAEPNNITVDHVEVEIRDVRGDSISFGEGLFNPFSRPASGRVPVQGGGVTSFEAIPSDYASYMRANDFAGTYGTVILDVRVFGETDGLTDVESRHYDWPVELLDTVINGDNCRSTDDDGAFSCRPGQDVSLVPYCSEI